VKEIAFAVVLFLFFVFLVATCSKQTIYYNSEAGETCNCSKYNCVDIRHIR
jgi:hypothetical protein